MFASSVKIYLEDTDAQGIVYHASYLRFFERSRSDWLDISGAGLAATQERGYRLVVFEMKIKFAKTAKLGDTLQLSTEVKLTSPFRLQFTQLAKRDGELVTRAEVEVVCISNKGDVAEISHAIPSLA
jgi:tol-pal system-associated acyl-CoA thioesterase